MRLTAPALLALLPLLACGDPKHTDTDTEQPADSEAPDSEPTDSEPTDSEPTDSEPAASEHGTLVWSTDHESPELTAGAYTTNNAPLWLLETAPVEGAAATAGLLHPAAGLTDTTPLAAPADGNQALYLNTQSGAWARATAGIVTMEAGTVYTLTAAIGLRTDVAVTPNMSVILANGADESTFAAQEVALSTLIDPELTGVFQALTLTYTATEDDVGDPLTLRFGAYQTEPALVQVLIDAVRVYER